MPSSFKERRGGTRLDSSPPAPHPTEAGARPGPETWAPKTARTRNPELRARRLLDLTRLSTDSNVGSKSSSKTLQSPPKMLDMAFSLACIFCSASPLHPLEKCW